jgi:hypothetical protein
MSSAAFRRRPTQRRVYLCRVRDQCAVLLAEFDPALTEEYQAQVVGSLEERTISGTRQLRVNQVRDEG